MSIAMIGDLLGSDADKLLKHECKGITKDQLILPGPDFILRVVKETDRNPQVIA